MSNVLFCRLNKPLYRKRTFIGWRRAYYLLILDDHISDNNIVIFWPFQAVLSLRKIPGRLAISVLVDSIKKSREPLSEYSGNVTREELEERLEQSYKIELTEECEKFLMTVKEK